MNLRKRQHEKGFYFLSQNGLLEKKFQISHRKEKHRKLNKKKENLEKIWILSIVKFYQSLFHQAEGLQ